MNEDHAMFVCHVCIEESFLSTEVKNSGSRKRCSYCSEIREAQSLKSLSDRIRKVLNERFKLVQVDFWQWSGTPIEELIANIAGLSEEIASDVRGLLSDRTSEMLVADGEDDPYGEEAQYEELEPDDWHFRDTWSVFRSDIRSRARFFSTYAEGALSKIFSDLHNHRTVSDQTVFREMGPDDEARFIWRARKSQSDKELKSILKSPAREIGPPPSRLAHGGRMNAPGIPVFYGAMDEDTCVAEARAPVGSKVVVAKFELLCSVRLLDFDALAEIFVKGSHFDPDYPELEARAAFLKRLVREISRPVMPQDETFEYLATQVVAEYLASKVEPRLDGIIFRSSQTGGTGRNLVLFNHACRVEPYELPESIEVKFRFPRGEEEDEDEEIVVFEDVSPNTKEKELPLEKGKRSGGLLSPPLISEPWWKDDTSSEDDELLKYQTPYLRLDLKSVVVLDIKRVRYDRIRRRVRRNRNTKSSQKSPLGSGITNGKDAERQANLRRTTLA